MAVRIWTGDNPETDKGPEYFDVSWAGKVVGRAEENGYDDSDFYAVVWDDDEGKPRKVWYASTRSWTYYNSAAVDAPDDVMEMYRAYQDAMRAERARQAELKEAATPSAGKTVRVIRGRKIAHGTQGEVFWHGQDRYGKGMRVGFATADGTKMFTAESNVEVIAQ